MVRVVPVPVVALVPLVSLRGDKQLEKLDDDRKTPTWLFVPVDVVFHSPYLLLGIFRYPGEWDECRGRGQGASLRSKLLVAHYIGSVMCIYCFWQARTSRLSPSRGSIGAIFLQRRVAYAISSRATFEYSRVLPTFHGYLFQAYL